MVVKLIADIGVGDADLIIGRATMTCRKVAK
jgi:hypothetical protein